ncbi:hypothetical protein L9F63_025571, partial [Diploptera punctata]
MHAFLNTHKTIAIKSKHFVSGCCRCQHVRYLHVGNGLFDKEPLKPSSKVEETVQALKENLKDKTTVPVPAEKPPLLKRIQKKVVDELVHYYHGFRLLFIDINISRRLVWKVLNGRSLTRREHRLLVRTVSDLFRLVPFSVFIIVPFMELLLPLAIKLFPGMLPSTFQTATEKEHKMKQALKVKLEMAKFLQQTLDDMAVQGKGRSSKSAKNFLNSSPSFGPSGELASNEEIMKFSKLFEDEITLDSLSRPQLTALCHVLRNLAADDKVIQKEGIESLTPAELQQACRARGMRAYGMSEENLRNQLAQWLELSLEKKVPPSLLLLSRALFLAETIPTSDQLIATISVLPDAATQTKAAIGEREGKVDNKTKIDIIKEEVRKIQEEKLEEKEEKIKIKEVAELIIDKAPIISEEIGLKPTTDKAVDAEKLKENFAEYQEDVDDLQKVVKVVDKSKGEVKESKAARRLFKVVNGMIGKMDAVVEELEREKKKLIEELEAKDSLEDKETQQKSEELVSIEELKDAIKQIQKVPDDSLVDRISEVLAKMDIDKDGAIRLDDVLKVIELVGKENVKLNKKQIDEIVDLLSKEELIELEEQIEKALEKGNQHKETKKDKPSAEMVQKIEKETMVKSSNPANDDKKTEAAPAIPTAMSAAPPGQTTNNESAQMDAGTFALQPWETTENHDIEMSLWSSPVSIDHCICDGANFKISVALELYVVAVYQPATLSEYHLNLFNSKVARGVLEATTTIHKLVRQKKQYLKISGLLAVVLRLVVPRVLLETASQHPEGRLVVRRAWYCSFKRPPSHLQQFLRL